MEKKCAKEDIWKVQRAINERHDRSLERIEGFMAKQTEQMGQIIALVERQSALEKVQEKDHELIEILFSRDREQEKEFQEHKLACLERLHRHEIEPGTEARADLKEAIKLKRDERSRLRVSLQVLVLTAAFNGIIAAGIWLAKEANRHETVQQNPLRDPDSPQPDKRRAP